VPQPERRSGRREPDPGPFPRLARSAAAAARPVRRCRGTPGPPLPRHARSAAAALRRVRSPAPHLYDKHLEPLAHAAKDTGADVWVMAPMVSTPAEAAAFA
jgi:hypothetical protein